MPLLKDDVKLHNVTFFGESANITVIINEKQHFSAYISDIVFAQYF